MSQLREGRVPPARTRHSHTCRRRIRSLRNSASKFHQHSSTSRWCSSSPIPPVTFSSALSSPQCNGGDARQCRWWTWVVVVVAMAALVVVVGADGAATFTECGGKVEGPHGIIQTPNFPNQFPVPIRCRWVIQAPNASKIMIHFTQFFLRHSFYIIEYDNYVNPTTFKNKNFLGEFDAEDDVNMVLSYRQFVVIDLVVNDANNINLRVDDFLRDVHGFNITYRIAPRDLDTGQNSCSAKDCSYLGNCLASADYSDFSCHCFPGFWGKRCEMGPFCDPDKGMNLCHNGGSCKYFYGSLINLCDCPPGYRGSKCESKVLGSFSEECSALQCAHRCDVAQDTGDLYCACHEGFKLDADQHSCVEEEYYRIFVQLAVRNQEHVNDDLEELLVTRHMITSRARHRFEDVLVSMRDFDLDLMDEEEIHFHFLVEKRDLLLVNISIQSLIKNGQFFGIAINDTVLSLQKSPELKLLGVENPDEDPVNEGKLLTLTCTARGSESMQFKWFKDGRPFNMTLTHRNAWEIRLPETIRGKRISVLNIDGVTTYDKGEFTCEISDFGRSINGSVLLNVRPYPVIEVKPLSASIEQGSSQVIRCISAVESDISAKYAWKKNNAFITESDPEVIEDLLPTGSRLLINNARTSANYTCQVTNTAGTSFKNIYVFVAEAQNKLFSCPANVLKSVEWNVTIGGSFDRQKCPTDTRDVSVRSLGDGYTKRLCTCQGSTCEWGHPNYVRCQSVHLINVYDEIMKIELGYKETTLMETFKKLYSLAQRAKNNMFAGDIDITAKNLHMIASIARDFPPLLTEMFNVTDLVNFCNILLEETFNMTRDEKKELLLGVRLIQVFELLIDLKRVKLVNISDVQSEKIKMQLTMMKSVEDMKNMVTDAVTGNIEKSPVTFKPVMVVRFDQVILPLLEREGRKIDPNENFLSDVFSYLPLNRVSGNYVINMTHRQLNVHSSKNTTFCFSWQLSKSESPTGQWFKTTCALLDSSANYTKCLCPLPGHFTVVSIPASQIEFVTEDPQSHLVLFMSCILSITCLLIVIVIYLRAWSFLWDVKNNIHFNFTLSITGINVVCLLCLAHSKDELMCLFGKIFLQLFTLSAFTFLLLDAIKIFTDIHSRSQARTLVRTLKFVMTGWGLPVLSVICVVLMMEVAGYDKQCSSWCWWTPSHHHFYSVLIPLIMLIVGHNFVLVLCVILVTKWNEKWSYRDKRKYLLEVGRSETLLVLLILCVVVGVAYDDKEAKTRQALVIICNLLLSFAVAILLTVTKKPMRLSAFTMCPPTKNASHKFSAFKAFVLPENHADHARAEAERIHEYCDRVDRERYTNEHRRQLRYLLSSSSASGSSSASPPPEETTTSSKTVRIHNHRVSFQRKDMSELSITDSGISSMCTASEKSSTTTPPMERVIHYK